jgi:hypothetical protein
MAETLFLRRGGLNALMPADSMSEEIMRSLPRSVTLKATLTQGRNVAHHRKFFALLKLVLDNQEYFQNIDELLYAIKLKLGYTIPIKLKDTTGYMPKSISFAKMDQREFTEFYERALDFIQAEVIPGIDREELAAEMEGF